MPSGARSVTDGPTGVVEIDIDIIPLQEKLYGFYTSGTGG